MSKYSISSLKRWASFSGNRHKTHRTDKKVANNLGKIKVPLPEGADKLFRNSKLEILDTYYESRQYDHLMDWESCSADGTHVPISKKQPKIIFNLPKVLSQRLSSKLVGEEVFPKFTIEDDPDTTEYLRMVIKASKLRSRIIEPVRRYLSCGSVFVRFYIEDGAYVMRHYLSKYCYPQLGPSGDLKSMRIRYTYEDKNDLDQQGRPKVKWYQIDLGPMSDILYDNPEFEPDKDEDPVFQVVDTAEHEMGFVQGEWLRTAEMPESPDGYSITEDILDFSDCLNYSLSQSDNAVKYNQDPQLWFKNMDQEELEALIRSSMKSWNLGREGEAGFLESSLNGVTTAMELRDKMKTGVMDIARVLLMDPEKLVASAQSGRAMEVLHGPMIDLIKELRPNLGSGIQSLVLKLAISNLIMVKRGLPSPVTVPPGYVPVSFDLTINWPPIFPMTVEDLQKKVSVTQQAVSGFLISEETGTNFVAKDFGIEDIEEEREKIAAQPVRNPFGAF